MNLEETALPVDASSLFLLYDIVSIEINSFLAAAENLRNKNVSEDDLRGLFRSSR